MPTTTPTTEVAVIAPEFSDTERYALSGFLAGYRGLTREAYALDLRQFIAWCADHDLRLFAVRRADIKCFARDLEGRGRARATVGRRLRTVAGFYRYAEQEGLLERSPATHDASLRDAPDRRFRVRCDARHAVPERASQKMGNAADRSMAEVP